MNHVVVDPSVTTGPIVGSTKVYIDGVPIRRVNLSNGEHLDLYDTSGPYTDQDAVIDLHAGLPPRSGVVRDRGTQLQRARAGEITAEMAFIAAREGVPAPSGWSTKMASVKPSRLTPRLPHRPT